MDLKISKMTWVHERNKFKILLFLFHEKMAQFEENSILQEFLDVFQNSTLARLALFGVAQSEALLYSSAIIFKTICHSNERNTVCESKITKPRD